MVDDSVHVPLPDYVREVAEVAARTVIREHVEACPIRKIEERVAVLEKRFAVLIGAIIGSGAFGGAVGGVIMKLFG
jgi:hypothetical protein